MLTCSGQSVRNGPLVSSWDIALLGLATICSIASWELRSQVEPLSIYLAHRVSRECLGKVVMADSYSMTVVHRDKEKHFSNSNVYDFLNEIRFFSDF